MAELNLWLGFGNLLCAVVYGALALPLMRGKIRRNAVYGIRFGAALESDEAWDRYNRIGGRYMLIWSIVIGALGIICLWWPPLTGFWIWFFGLAPAYIGVGFWQTHRAGKRDVV